ncbi:MAG: hypothetical protein JO246_09355 [Frankiaceae bacterium]|nr:hypothetical protein [Frankiaceae bacterium]
MTAAVLATAATVDVARAAPAPGNPRASHSAFTTATRMHDAGDVTLRSPRHRHPATGSDSGLQPNVASRKTDGIAEGQCSCSPADVSIVEGADRIVEVAESSINVYDADGTQLGSTPLETMFGTTDDLVQPRVAFDTTRSRFIVVASDAATARLYVAVSNSPQPRGTWRIGFLTTGQGGRYDFPMIGMAADSFVVTTNNFDAADTYVGSAVYIFPKTTAYGHTGDYSVTTAAVPFGTAPAVTAGAPIATASRLYLLAADDAADMLHLYYLSNTTPTDPPVTLAADIPYSFAAPSRPINQPDGRTLVSGDGRITSSPTQVGNWLYFAHEVDADGFPGVSFGRVNLFNHQLQTALAYHGNTTDDFNPSITAAVSPDRGGNIAYEINWAYTNVSVEVGVTDVAAIGVGAPRHLTGVLLDKPGHVSSPETAFSRYSGAATVYDTVGSCRPGTDAIVANQYFAPDGTWKTRFARVGTC